MKIPDEGPCRHSPLLISTAVLAMLWAVARAAVQSITVDEADSYLLWASSPWPSHWWPNPNNHVLNSMLMRLFTMVFGASHLSVRLPALIGAAIYISCAYGLCRCVAWNVPLRLVLLLCLIINPLIFDHLIAARGYSLAMGFLMAAIALTAYYMRPAGRKLDLGRLCAACATLVALAFASNFAFGVVGCATMLLIYFWACAGAAKSEPVRSRRLRVYLRLAAACLLPGLLVTVFLSTPALQFPKDRPIYGATSLPEMLQSLIQGSLYELNPYILNDHVLPVLKAVQHFVLPLTALAAALHLLLLYRSRRLLRDPRSHWLAVFGGFLAAIIALTLTAHWLLYRLAHILLPKDRTAIFFAPLCTLALGVIAALPPATRATRTGRRTLVALLATAALSFLFCSRLTYFREWKFDADTKEVYSVLSYYNHRCGVTDVPSCWLYVSSLNYYRTVSGHETLAQFVDLRPQPYPTGRQVYVLDYGSEHGFIEKNALAIVYRGVTSGVVVAVRSSALHCRP